MNFKLYQSSFETGVVVQGVRKGLIGKIERVSLSPGALARSPFGKLLETVLQAGQVLCLDYYGLKKFSQGLLNLIEHTRQRERGKQIRHIECYVVHFSSIRFEDIVKLAPELVGGFPQFKKTILDARGFNHSYRP